MKINNFKSFTHIPQKLFLSYMQIHSVDIYMNFHLCD